MVIMSVVTGSVKGNDPAVVNIINGYVNQYYASLGNLKEVEQSLEKLENLKPRLHQIPYYEQYYRKVLDQYQKAAEQLKTDAKNLEAKTNHSRRQLCQEHKSISRSSISFLKVIHTEAGKESKKEYLAGISDKRKESERRENEAITIIQRKEAAAKEYSEIDKTFPTQWGQLLKENPIEYLRQATLYQYKLLEKKDEAGFFAFNVSWIKNLPKEASWQQVEKISLFMVQLAETNPSIDLTEYRGAVQQWLNKHLLPENSGDPSSGPARSPSDRLTHVLGLLYIYNNQPLDLSDEAYQVYKRCNVLFPEQEVWKMAKEKAFAAIEYSTIHKTFPSSREKLLKENPSEYLRQATLYQCKLLEKKDEKGLFAFGVSWIKDLPEEATWEQIESTSLLMIGLASANANINLTEYRGALQQWLKKYPPPENSTPDPTSPSGRLTHVLGLLYVYNNQPLDLSNEAFKIYQRCSVLFPEQEVWKVAKEGALASIKFSTIDETFPKNREKLLKENPSEYLHQATLYKYKLLEKKDEAGLFAFGVSWIKTLPKEATWEQVENMSQLMIKLATTNENINLTEYREALQQWLKKYPLPKNSTPDPTSPSGRLTHVLGWLYICNKDLSDEAFKVYQECSALFPEQEEWKMAKEAAFASIEYSNIDQTFPNIREKLLKENPSEYLRQAIVHQDKLQEKKDAAGFFSFGVLLIKNLPKEATWSQVENLSLRMVELAKINPNIDLTEYRNAVQQWLKEHPLPENPTPDPTSPSGRRTYVLGMLYICNHQSLDLSDEAFQIYQRCSVLFPEENVWKVAQVRVKVSQALDHINHLRWEKAQELLDDLPQDDPYVRNTQIDLNYYRRERISSAVIDVGIPVLLKFLPDSYKESPKVDCGLTILNLVTNSTVRKMWVPRLLGMPEKATYINSFPKLVTAVVPMVGDVVDCVFRHNFSKPFQSSERVASTILRTAYAAYSLYSEFPLLSPLPAVSMGSWALSTGQSYLACREIRLSHTRQALVSTLQLVASDFALGAAVFSYSDLLPAAIQPQQIARMTGAKSLIDRVSRAEKGSIKDQWLLAAVGIGVLAAFRFYHDYPYLWAASVMGDIEYHSSKGRDDEVQRVLTNAENCYFVRSVKAHVREYALYAISLKAYPMCLYNVTSRIAFFERVDLLLNKTLNASHHYKGIRNGVLLKKMDAVIQKHDSTRLKAVFNERPHDKIALFGFQLFLNHAFSLALKHPAAPYSFIHEMKPAFPANYQTLTDAFLELLQDHTVSIQEWTQLKMTDAPPTKEQIERWNNALPKLQEFFFKHVGEAEVYKTLQYFELMSVFVQAGETQTCFEKSPPELHERFCNELIRTIKLLRKDQAYPMADDLLKRAQINSFNYHKLIQDYAQFFPLIHSAPLQREAASKKLLELQTCISSLNPQDECHEQLRPFFESCRVVLSLDAGQYAAAQKLLQETAEVHDEVAAILFERIYARSQGSEKALSELKIIIDNLGQWQHLELFKTYASILSKPQAKLDSLASVRDHIEPLEQLPHFTYLFESLLSQERFDEARVLFSAPVLPTLHTALCNLLDMFLIERAERVPLHEVVAHLQRDVTFFNIPNIQKIQSYVHFRALFDTIEGEKDIAAVQNVRQSLLAIFEIFNAMGRPIPVSLKNKMGNVLMNIANLAVENKHRETGLEAVESIPQFILPNGQTEQFINLLRRRLQN